MDGSSIVFERPAQSFRNYESLTNTIVLDQPEAGTGGTSAPVTIPHGGAVALWGDLPAAGTFTTETRQVGELAGNPEGRVGPGSAFWDGSRWIPQGGTLPSSSTDQYYEGVLDAATLNTVTLPFTVTDTANSEVFFGGNRLPKSAYTLINDKLTFTFTEFPREVGDRFSGTFAV